MSRSRAALALSLMVGCAGPAYPPEAACDFWAIRRAALPRPLPASAEARWIAITDQGMSAACHPDAPPPG